MRSRGLIRSASMNRSFFPGSCGQARMGRHPAAAPRRAAPAATPTPDPQAQGQRRPRRLPAPAPVRDPCPGRPPDLLQQVDELVSRQPLQDPEVRRLGRVAPPGEGHGGDRLGTGNPRAQSRRGRNSAATDAAEARGTMATQRCRALRNFIGRGGRGRAGHVATPRSSNRRCSAPSRAALVPRSPDTTRAAHWKYSCTRSADHPAGTRATSLPAPPHPQLQQPRGLEHSPTDTDTQTDRETRRHRQTQTHTHLSPLPPLPPRAYGSLGPAGWSPSPRCRCRGRYLAGCSGSGPAGCAACPPA